MNHPASHSTIFHQKQFLRKYQSVPFGSKPPELKETIFAEGSKYHLAVLSDQDGQPIAYRLREAPIDPQRDYTYSYRDFEIMGYKAEHPKDALSTALDEFYKGNAAFEKIIEQSKFYR